MFDQLMATVPMIHALATWFMVGLIWFVQIVHYPLMSQVSPTEFAGYSKEHQRRTTWVVAPSMGVEAVSALVLLASQASGARAAAWIGAALLVIIWLSTFAVQVPLHARLGSGFDREVWRKLVLTNWVRTIAWSARGAIAVLHLA